MATSDDVIKFIQKYYSNDFSCALKILDKNKPSKKIIGKPPKNLDNYYEFYKAVEILTSFAPLDETGKETGQSMSIEQAIIYIEKENMFPGFMLNSAKYFAVKKEIKIGRAHV